MSNNNRNTLKNIVTTFLEVQNQMRIYHWQTQSFARHKASDQFIETFGLKMDLFMEILQGKKGRIKINSNNIIKLKNLSDNDMVQYIKEFKYYLLNNLTNTLDKKNDTDLLNLKDEIVAELNKLLYLFTFE